MSAAVGVRHCCGRLRARRNRRRTQYLDQVAGAGCLDADRFDDRHTEFGRQAVGIDDDAFAPRDVRHVQSDDHGQAQPLQAQHQPQILAQIGRIRDAHDEVGRGLARAPPEQYIRGDLFVGRQRVEAVGSGQIEDADAMAGGRLQRTLLAFDGHAGVVGDFLPAARQNIEQRRLAAVGIADQRDQGTRMHTGQRLHGPNRASAAPGKRGCTPLRTAAARKCLCRCVPRWGRAPSDRVRRFARPRPAESRVPPGAFPIRAAPAHPRRETETTRATIPVARSASFIAAGCHRCRIGRRVIGLHTCNPI